MRQFNYCDDSKAIQDFAVIKSLCCENQRSAIALEEHFNDGIELCIAFDGSYEWIVEGQEVSIKNEEISITLPWQKHAGKDAFMSKGRLAWIIIKPEIFSETGKLAFGDSFGRLGEIENELGRLLLRNRHINLGKSKWFIELFFRLEQEIRERDRGYTAGVYFCLSQMMLELYRMLNRSEDGYASPDQRILTAIDIINRDIDRKWTTEDIEALTSLKKTALNKYFKELTGYAPINYVMRQKVEKSKEMLRSDKSITDIAFELNFSSSQHFSSTFKKYTGYTPISYKTKYYY